MIGLRAQSVASRAAILKKKRHLLSSYFRLLSLCCHEAKEGFVNIVKILFLRLLPYIESSGNIDAGRLSY